MIAHRGSARVSLAVRRRTGWDRAGVDAGSRGCVGGGKCGHPHGRDRETDEWSYKAAVNPTYCYDIHATILNQLGIAHEKLTYRHNGVDRRLTDVHGEVIREIVS